LYIITHNEITGFITISILLKGGGMNRINSAVIVCCAGILTAGALAGCGKKEQAANETKPIITQEPVAQEQAQPQKNGAVCIYDGISLKQDPTKSGKWLASISLGESVEIIGDSAVDSSDKNRSYQNIKLSDGKSGWATSYGLALNARLAAIKQVAVIYKRPDLLTGTDVKLEIMSPVAVLQEKEGWSEFIGAARKKSGWLRSDALTTDPADVAVAVLAQKKIVPAKDRAEAIKAFIAATPYPESFFIKKLQEEISPVQTPAVEPAAEESGESATEESTEPEATEEGD
jgi:hypothetical protein